jgi:mannan endo-1,4-beta-mannosidase
MRFQSIFSLIFITSWLTLFAQTNDLPGLRIEGRHLYDRCGEKIIGIGVNEMSIWDGNNHTGTGYLSEVEKTGANMIRLVWMPSGDPADLDKLLANTLAAKMIPMPELHGATGDLSKLPSQVDYWVRSDVVAVIKKYEKDILVNIANESGNHNVSNAQFTESYKTAISRMREAGYRVPLVIDAPGWGQNIDVLQATWQTLQNHDPLHNILFSVHTWWVNSSDGSKARITTELQETVNMGMPLIVGEFAPMGVGCSRYIDYKFLMSEANKHEIGWLAWSWGKVGNGDCSEMGMTTDGVFGNWRNTPNDGKWGEVVSISDPNSISNSAVRPYSIINGTCADSTVRTITLDKNSFKNNESMTHFNNSAIWFISQPGADAVDLKGRKQ